MALIRATITGTYGGNRHMNVLHFWKDNATEQSYGNLAGTIAAFWIDWFRLNTDSNMQWHRIQLEDIHPEVFDPYEQALSLVGVGAPSASWLPMICACFLLKTSFPGRSGRGRHFVGGFGHTGQYANGRWNTVTQNKLDAIVNELKTYWVADSTFTDNWKVVVAARADNPQVHLVTDIVARNIVSTMNTRKLFRGA